MEPFKGYYYLADADPWPATIFLEKNRIVISIKNEYGKERLIYWPYEQVVREQFWKNGAATVVLQGYPSQRIEVNAHNFAQRLEETLNSSNKWGRRAWSAGVMTLVKVFIFFLALIAAAYLWLVPFLADRMARKVPISYEESLGNTLFDAMKGGFLIDQRKTAVINEFFGELKIPTKYNIRITVVNEKVSNAFAMPGGNIVVYDHLISQMQHYSELAALLTHEFTHVNNKHTTRSLFRKLGSSIFLSVILGDLGAMTTVIVSNTDNLKDMNYSRSLERESDLNGVKLLSERKIDCNGFVRMFNILKRQEDSTGVKVPEWTNSHPNLEKRIRYVQKSSDFNQYGIVEDTALSALFVRLKSW